MRESAAKATVRLSVVQYAKCAFQSFQADDCLTGGAALAYFTVFSLAPLLLTVISIAGLVLGRDAVQHQIENQIQALLGSGAAWQTRTMISHAAQDRSGGILATIIGIVVLIFGATATFGSLQTALNRVWHVEVDPATGGIKAFVRKRVLSFGMIMGVAFLLIASLALSAILSAVGTKAGRALPAWISTSMAQVVGFIASLLVITVLFAAIFKFLPDARIEWRDVGVGAVLTSLLFTIGKTAIGIYLGRTATASEYGAAGSFVVIVVWLYYASLILLFGAEFTKVWAMAHGRPREPDAGAVKVIDPEQRPKA